MDDDRIERWNELAAQLGVDSIRATTEAGSGHPTSSLSAAHLVAVLFADHLRIDLSDPASAGNDRFVLSKGHAAPVLYAALKAIGMIDDAMLLSLRRFGSPIQGHPAPVPELPLVEAATGSLGHGPAIGLGMALAMRLDESPARVWVLLGDSEAAEGSVWEAMEAAAHHEVGALTCVLDMNRLGQRGPTMHGWDADLFVSRAETFGWHALSIDGHDVAAIDEAYRRRVGGRPSADVDRGQDREGPRRVRGWRIRGAGTGRRCRRTWPSGRSRSSAASARSRSRRPSRSPGCRRPRRRPPAAPRPRSPTRSRRGRPSARRLAWLAGERADLVVLDGEVGNSTYTEDVERVAPDRFVQLYIAEQTMVGAQIGLQALGKTAFAATFGAFLTRAYDQIRMASIGRADLRLCGSHAGVSIGEDGPSQMALEDLAAFRAIEGSTVLYPADANATVRLVAAMADREGISYVRTTREATPSLYDEDEDFPIGDRRRSATDRT